MIAHGKEIKVFAGNSNIALAEDICAELYRELGNATVSQFADGECSVSLLEPVRGKDVFIISYNEFDLNEVVLNGLTTISTDFKQMGKTAAMMILNRKSWKVHCDFNMTRRGTF